MTWHFDPTGETVDVYDHLGNRVASDVRFSGSWSNTPDKVYRVMAQELRAAATNGNIEYAVECLADALADDIKQGTP